MTFLYIDMFNIYLLHNTVLTFIYYYFKSSKTVELFLSFKPKIPFGILRIIHGTGMKYILRLWHVIWISLHLARFHIFLAYRWCTSSMTDESTDLDIGQVYPILEISRLQTTKQQRHECF